LRFSFRKSSVYFQLFLSSPPLSLGFPFSPKRFIVTTDAHYRETKKSRNLFFAFFFRSLSFSANLS
ncbi:hypothetical protein, partial [Providencia vermicola]|uniref:hypothetical protein n=1 Tax=Providencia vermicola TaxID=333965 RepID=UPI00363C35B9